MKIFRRITFLLFCVVFAAGIPRIIFYALGYSFQPGVKQGIVHSGLIFLSTAPPGAEIYVNGRRYSEPTPAIIPDLLPGNYSIRLNLKDYFPWTRTVTVDAGKATVLGQILLRSRKPDWKERIPQSYDQLIPIPATHDLLLRDGDRKVETYDWKYKKRKTLFDAPEIKWRAIQSLYVTPGSFGVLAIGKDSSNVRARWAKIGGAEAWVPWPAVWDDFKDGQAKWDSHDERYLFAVKGGEMQRADLYQKTTSSFLSGVRGFDLENRRVFYFSGNAFSSLDVTGKSPKAIWIDADNFLGAQGWVEITSVSSEKAFFLNEEGRLVTNDPPRVIATEGVKGISFDKKNQKLLFWTQKSLMVAEWITQKTSLTETSYEIETRNLFPGARSIQAAFWAHDGAYVVYQDQNKVFLLEPQALGDPSVYELFEVKNGSAVYYSEDSGEIFYLDKNTGHLMSLELIPKWKVMEVPLTLIREKVKELEA